jgi:hypothetical protein
VIIGSSSIVSKQAAAAAAAAAAATPNKVRIGGFATLKTISTEWSTASTAKGKLKAFANSRPTSSLNLMKIIDK